MRAAACRRLPLASCSSSSSALHSRRLLLSTTKTPAAAAAAAAPHAIWLPMPHLAPHMTTGRVHAWLKAEGDVITCYDVIAELASDNLVEGAHRVGRFEGEVTLLLEAQEECWRGCCSRRGRSWWASGRRLRCCARRGTR